jgi:dsRNA-specific ribonuclease
MNSSSLARRGDLNALQQRLGYSFTNPELLANALDLKRVSAQEGRGYDRLEKYGDRLLYPIILSLIEERYPNAPLCELTRMERVLVCNLNLAHLAVRLDLMSVLIHRYPNFIYVEKTLADLFEAIVAAIAKDAGAGSYLQGICRLHAVCKRLFHVDLELAQIDDPLRVFAHEIQTRWGEKVAHQWLPLTYAQQPIGYTCKLNLKRNAARALQLPKARPFIIGTGVTTEQSLRKAAGIGLLRLWPKRYPNSLPENGSFSWRIR